MKKISILTFIILTVITFYNNCFAAQKSFEDRKKEIIAVYNSNNLEEAYNMISKITEDERDYELWYLLGNLSQDFNNEKNAVFFFQKSILLNKDFDKAHFNLGNIYLNQKKYNNAINEFKSAIKIKKDYPYYYYNLGCAYMGQKEYKSAKSEFEKAIKLKNTEPDFYYNLALTNKYLRNTKDAQKALDIYNKLKENEK